MMQMLAENADMHVLLCARRQKSHWKMYPLADGYFHIFKKNKRLVKSVCYSVKSLLSLRSKGPGRCDVTVSS